MKASSYDPVIAIATAPGRGGIGVIRLSGTGLHAWAEAVFGRSLQARHAHFLPLHDQQGELMDEAIVLFFPGPHSYTGEDVLELQGHGGPAVLQRVLDDCLARGRDIGLRLAQPGEFTQRAFLNGRLDLAQAEAVADLIEASSTAAARSAMASLSGEFSRQINALNEQIVHLRMLIEATLDFPEEEIDFLEKYQAADRLDAITRSLHGLITTSEQGLVLREGMHVVLVGQPNVGKSSLLNALAGDEVAIVTSIAGTTRDRVIQQIHLQGVPLHVVDTAGLRETQDPVEQLGIQRTWVEIEKAQLILHLQDARQPADPQDELILQRLPAGIPVLRVLNKLDLLPEDQQQALLHKGGHGNGLGRQVLSAQEIVDRGHSPADAETPTRGRICLADRSQARDSCPQSGQKRAGTVGAQSAGIIAISALTGQGLNELRERLLQMAGWNPGSESPWLARQRHLRALELAREHIGQAVEHAAHSDQVLDLLAEELRLAHESLCEITGEFTSDDLLGEIFSSFCIGK